MAIFKLGGNDMPSPAEMLHSFRSIGKSEENAAGSKVFDRLALKHDLTVTWHGLTEAQANALISNATGTTFVDVYFFDVNANSYVTESCSAEVKKIKDGRYTGSGTATPAHYVDIQINFEQR